jgi:hypothetical protein
MSCDIHGVALEVSSDDDGALVALEQRLAAFPEASAPDVQLEFRAGAAPEPPPGPSRPVYDTPYGQLHYFPEADVLHGRLSGDVGFHCDAGGALLTAPAFTGLALYLTTHSLTTIALIELLRRRGRFALHAGCLALADGSGVLVAAPSGGGKSTLTMALARAGLGYLSDDIVFLRRDDERVTALSFADAVGVTPATAGMFPELAVPPAPPEGFPKHLVRMEEAFPSVRLLDACVPTTLLRPHVAPHAACSATPLAGGDAYLGLVPDVLLTDPATTSAHMATIAALVEQVRCYDFASGEDVLSADPLVAELTRAASAGPV